jgi:site-specific DNA recombinase
VSGDDRGKDGRNLAGQLDMCRDYALSTGYIVVVELAEDERGAKGASFDLEKLNQALDMARAGKFDVLVVRELDRFARSLAKQLIIEAEFKRAGVQVEYALGNTKTRPKGYCGRTSGQPSLNTKSKIAERLNRGKRAKVRAGHMIVHAHRPYGYKLTERDGKQTLKIYEPEAQIVRLIYQWYVKGDDDQTPMNITAIAHRLTQMSIPSPADGKPGKAKKRGSGIPSTSRNKTRLYYRCPGTIKHHTARDCTAPHFRVDRVDAAVWACLKSWLLDPEQLMRGLNAYRENANAQVAPQR